MPAKEERFADLHVHTRCSDGVDAPARVIERAVEHRLSGVAITDHDSVAGLAEGREAAEAHGLEFVDGVEISADGGHGEVHVVGLGVDPVNPELVSQLDWLARERARRADRILERLAGLGVVLDEEAIQAQAGSVGVVGRLHIARQMHQQGFVKTVQEAFDRYIGRGRRGFVQKTRMPLSDAVGLIRRAGGLAFLAHPGLCGNRARVERLLHSGFDGIEAYHIEHTPAQVERYLQMAEERSLLVAGGSDCHGAAKTEPEMGKVLVPYVYLERLKEALSSRTQTPSKKPFLK